MYNYKKDINKSIFKAYDLRGKYPEEINEDTVYSFGLGFGTHVRNMGGTKAIVGHDNRLSSDALYNALIEGITSTGVDVIRLGLVTTPMYYYACIKLNIYSGVMVTASHNPKDDNGLKFGFTDEGNCKGQEITDLYDEIVKGDFITGKGTITDYNIRPDYIELFKTNLHFGDRRLKVVMDPANGTTSIIAKDIYELFPMDLIVINGESDGHFPNHHPDPSIEDNLEQLKQKVLEEHADIGVSFDGDGDRLGIITNTGKFMNMDSYMIAIVRDIINKVDKKVFMGDVKCSKSFQDECRKLGGDYLICRTGNSYTKACVKDNDLPFGAELSGHIYFRDRWPGFDSGLYAGLRLLEILSKTNKTCDELDEGKNVYYSTIEYRIPSNNDTKFQIIDKVKDYVVSKNYKFLDIDGLRVEFNDGWALVRASNTGPLLSARFEGNTEARKEEIEKEFMDLINELNK